MADAAAPRDAEPSSSSALLVEGPGDGGVRVLVLNRPGRRNALDTALLRRLLRELAAADSDPRVRAIVLRAEGPAFCAGGDTKEFDGRPDARELMAVRAGLLGDVLVGIRRHRCPVAAAVHGAALGAGAAVALAADFTVAEPRTEFGFPEFAQSVVPSIVLPLLARQVHLKPAFDVLTTGRRLDAAAAVAVGMVSRVSDPGLHVDEAVAVARQWAAVDPVVAQETKRLLHEAFGSSSLEDAMRVGLAVTAATWRPAR